MPCDDFCTYDCGDSRNLPVVADRQQPALGFDPREAIAYINANGQRLGLSDGFRITTDGQNGISAQMDMRDMQRMLAAGAQLMRFFTNNPQLYRSFQGQQQCGPGGCDIQGQCDSPSFNPYMVGQPGQQFMPPQGFLPQGGMEQAYQQAYQRGFQQGFQQNFRPGEIQQQRGIPQPGYRQPPQSYFPPQGYGPQPGFYPPQQQQLAPGYQQFGPGYQQFPPGYQQFPPGYQQGGFDPSLQQQQQQMWQQEQLRQQWQQQMQQDYLRQQQQQQESWRQQQWQQQQWQQQQWQQQQFAQQQWAQQQWAQQQQQRQQWQRQQLQRQVLQQLINRGRQHR